MPDCDPVQADRHNLGRDILSVALRAGPLGYALDRFAFSRSSVPNAESEMDENSAPTGITEERVREIANEELAKALRYFNSLSEDDAATAEAE